MAQKRIPLRMCAICREQYPKRELIRLVKSADGQVALDETGKKPGRGLYVCKSQTCLTQALKGTRLEKAVGASIGTDILAALGDLATDDVEMNDGR
ncbi:MAG: YlxR family protein [Clostridiales bacterium]|nr:YlxR family protein [Clostridiales bacterium]